MSFCQLRFSSPLRFLPIFGLSILALLTCSLSLTATGCGPQKPATTSGPATTTVAPETLDTAESTPTQPGEKVKLVMWVMPNSPEPQTDLEKVIAPFKKANPNIDVEVTVIDWGAAWLKITTAATSGDAPDIVQLGSTWVGAISAMGALLDLKNNVAETGGGAAFVPAAWTTAGIAGSGQVTTIPWFVDVRALFYRTDVFRRLNLTAADLNTWDSFQATLEKIKAADLSLDGKKIKPLGISGKNDWNVIHSLSPWIWGAGGNYFTPDNKQCALDSPEVNKGLMFYIDLVAKGLVPLDCLELNTSQVSGNFNNGEYAMYFDGPYQVKILTTPTAQGGAADSAAAKNFGVALYPKGPVGRFNFVGGSNLAIFKYSKHKKEAWELLKHLVSNSAQVEYAKSTGFLPSKLAAFADPFFAADPNRAVFKQAVQYGKTYPCIPAWGKLEPQLTRRFGIMWDYVLKNPTGFSSEDLAKQMKKATQEVDAVLNQ